MQPIKRKSSESGVTLVELTISLAIVMLIATAAYQMLIRSLQYTSQKKIVVSTQTEIDQLLGVTQKDWDYRANESVAPNAPTNGQKMLTANYADCNPGPNVVCPKLRLWLLRNIGGAKMVDVVTIENVCRRPTKVATRQFIESLNPGSHMDADCGTCPSGEIPSVQIAGLNLAGEVFLASENRLFPQNATLLGRVKTDGILGMQACFRRETINGPISVDVRAVYPDQSGQGLQLVKKTQVFPYENFASIRLEQ